MANEIKELRNLIAVSLYLSPCTVEELKERECFRTKSLYGLDMMVAELDRRDATFYKGDIIHIKKKWAKANLTEYELDFRTEKQKFKDGLSPFVKQVYKSQGLI